MHEAVQGVVYKGIVFEVDGGERRLGGFQVLVDFIPRLQLIVIEPQIFEMNEGVEAFERCQSVVAHVQDPQLSQCLQTLEMHEQTYPLRLSKGDGALRVE